MDESRKHLPTSAVGRLLKLGGLAGRIGASAAREGLRRGLRERFAPSARRALGTRRQAEEVAAVLGSLKGVPMKIGQMLSLHEDFLPPQVAEVLRSLQQDAPSVPFDDIQRAMRQELGSRADRIAEIEPQAWAAASIGQVHRGRLKDGQWVAFKIQYPGIGKIIAADLKNLKGPLGLIFGMFTEADLAPAWDEVAQRLREELDYGQEARHMVQMARLYRDDPRIVIPGVLAELTTRQVLCMEYVAGLSARCACSESYPQDLRDQWGQVLLDFVLRGLFRHRFLHADPNLANFAFLPDGRLVVYDFGCVKRVPSGLRNGYARLTRAVLEERSDDLEPILSALGIYRLDGQGLPRAMLDDYAAVMRAPFQADCRYRFGGDRDIYTQLMELSRQYWQVGAKLHWPKDIVFIDRTLAGHFGNLCRLSAAGPWRQILTDNLADS